MIDLPERRAHERDACRIAAKIELAERLPVAVALADISPGGVRLRVTDGAHLPDEFDLLIPLLGASSSDAGSGPSGSMPSMRP